MTWTTKHDKLSIRNNWWQSAERAAKFIFNRVPSARAVEFEFERKDFEKYLKRSGGKIYHRTMTPKIIKHLEEKSDGLIVVLRDYGYGVYKLLVLPISYLSENRNPKPELELESKRGNPMYSEEQKKRHAQQQQQNINKVDELLREVGLKYDPAALEMIWRLSGKCIERIVKSIELLLYRNSTEKVRKPHGFIVKCLRDGWSKDFDIYYEPELPVFSSRMQIDKFVSDITGKILDKKNTDVDLAPT